MNRRGLLLGFASAVAMLAVGRDEAEAQAVECYNPAGAPVPCRRPSIARGVVRRGVRRKVVRKARKRRRRRRRR
jgi:hypothetical protein